MTASTGIVILAAGESARMGEPKQLLMFRGKTLLHHTIDTALSISGAPVVVVLGAHAAQIRTRLDATCVLVEENSDWRDGMGGSVSTGLRVLLTAHPAISAVIFLVCDQPFLSATTLGVLIATHQQSGRAIIASEYSGALGVPALFARTMFPELLALEGNEGARQLIHAHRDQVVGIPFPDGSVDLDTPADYAAFSENSNALSV